MNTNQFKSYLNRKPPERPKQKDLTTELIDIAQGRMLEIEAKMAVLTTRILDAKYDYFQRKMQKEKRELMDAWEFNRQLILSLKGEGDVL